MSKCGEAPVGYPVFYVREQLDVREIDPLLLCCTVTRHVHLLETV
jgi:hypothetical protein